MIVDLTEDQARRALLKWRVAPPDVLPAWVAEMDYALAEPVHNALREAVEAGITGYPDFDDEHELGAAYAGFAQREFGHAVAPEHVYPTVDVTAGVRVALDVFSEPGAVIFPIPGYPPQHAIAQLTGRERVDMVLDPDAERAELDLDQLDRLFAQGARTLLLTQPHNPWGRVFTREELEGVRDVVLRHGARVISDEIHAPLVLDGREHVPYLSIDGAADHTVAVVASSKAFNTPGLRCAQLVVATDDAAQRLRHVPMVQNDSWSPLGVIGAIAAYEHGGPWLAALRERIAAQRDLLTTLLAEHLPEARMRPMEATYLAWLDLRAYGHDDPGALALEKGRVWVQSGQQFQPDLPGHVRMNIATSPERLTEIVRRLAAALV